MAKSRKPPDPRAQAIAARLMPLGEVQPWPMFGGHGLYADGLFFALIIRGELYLKADDGNRAAFEARLMDPFRPHPDRPHISMSYYRVPAEIFDGPDLIPLAESAVAAARRSLAKRNQKKGRKIGGEPAEPSDLEGFGRPDEGDGDE